MRNPSPLIFLIVSMLALPFGFSAAHADPFVDAIEAYAQEDYAAALERLNALAGRGDVRASCWLGFMYQNGKGVRRNSSEAATWYRKAADLGCPRAAYRLGRMHETGEGVPLNVAEAAKWYRNAAEQGNADAQEGLGALCARGAGVTQDYVEAYMWLDLAARRSRPPATGGDAAKKRDSIASGMTPAQVAEARRLAREWIPKNGQ